MAKKKVERPIPAKVDAEFLGLVLAHHARRLTARNMLVVYGTNMGKPPGFGIGGTDDLLLLHQDLEYLEEAMETSEKLFEVIELKRIQAQGMIERVRNEEMEEDRATEVVKQVMILNREIGRLTEIMEGMAGA